MNITDPKQTNLTPAIPTIAVTAKTGVRQALEDAAVVAGASLASALIAVQGMPSWSVLYAVGLPSILVGISTYALKRGISTNV